MRELRSAPLPVEAGLVRLSFLVQSVYAEVAARYELTAQQAQLLCVVKDQPRRMIELTGMLGLEKSSLSGLVDRAERRDLLRRSAAPQDRRAVMIEPTSAGRRIAEAFHTEVSERLRHVVDALPAVERAQFTRLASLVVLAGAVPPVFS